MVSLSAETRLLGTVFLAIPPQRAAERVRPLAYAGAAMPAPNYRQQKRQKELARQSRQAEKDARRAKKDTPAVAATADDASQQQPSAGNLPIS